MEVATAAHTGLLQSYGLLDDGRRLQANRPLRSSTECQGLVIDDFFALSVEDRGTPPEMSGAFRAYSLAQKAYSDASLLGSPSKDVAAETSGKLIGAFVNGKPETLQRGLCPLGAPPEKRYALSHLTFELCKLSHTTDSLHLCLLGAWTSILCYRRPLLSLLNHSFRLVSTKEYDPNHPKLLPLPRKVACELVLVSTLAVFAIFDLCAQYDHKIYCTGTDASKSKGAIVSAEVGPKLCEIMWKGLKSKGAYTRLLTPAESILNAVGDLDPTFEEFADDGPSRPLAFHFDFIEIYAGASLLSEHLSSWGFVCGPPIEISASREFDMSEVRVIEWLSFLVSEKRLLSFFLCPPCTTFSIMRRPALRSQIVPFGFDPCEEKTSLGNLLAHRSMQLMYVGAQNDAVGMTETPWSSFMKHLPSWKSVSGLTASSFVRTDSCRFGSPHQKGFRFLGINLDLGPLSKRCTCVGKHVQIQGVYTKSSAIYTEELSKTIALVFKAGILKVKSLVHGSLDQSVKGLENQLCNEVALTSPWREESSWTFRKDSHINILEMASLLRLVQRLSDRCCPLRVVSMVDSHVAKGAASKGRTASLGLGSVLRRLNAHMVASSIFMCIPFVPTRLNPSDDPTRDREVRQPIHGMLMQNWTEDQLLNLMAVPSLRRWTSNWVRLVVLTLGPDVLLLSRRDLFRQSSIGGTSFFGSSSEGFEKDPRYELPFDSTLGFPGEEWYLLIFVLFGLLQMDFVGLPVGCLVFLLLSCPLSRVSPVFCCCCCWLFCFTGDAMAMPVFPVTRSEWNKADSRRHVGPIPVGRPVLPVTGSNRQKLLQNFLGWTKEESIDFEWMLNHHYETIDEINLVLARYGRLLYDAGKTYNSYAELLNSITSWKPAIRRLLQGAWDLGYSWKRLEPGEHHVAMPPQILLGMITTAIYWGWIRCAGCLAIGFAGLLRPGEILAATRADLLLPADCGYTINHALLSIREPKSRFTNARHQTAKIDIQDMLAVCELAFQNLAPLQRLWPHSGQTFRSRFKSLLAALSLPSVSVNDVRALDPGSLRAGGATFIISTTECGELCRRRGRWANFKMMEIYVQELNAVLYLKKISELARSKILAVGGIFPEVLEKVKTFSQAKIPVVAWRFLLFRWKSPVKGAGVWSGKEKYVSSGQLQFGSAAILCLHSVDMICGNVQSWQTVQLWLHSNSGWKKLEEVVTITYDCLFFTSSFPPWTSSPHPISPEKYVSSGQLQFGSAAILCLHSVDMICGNVQSWQTVQLWLHSNSGWKKLEEVVYIYTYKFQYKVLWNGKDGLNEKGPLQQKKPKNGGNFEWFHLRPVHYRSDSLWRERRWCGVARGCWNANGDGEGVAGVRSELESKYSFNYTVKSTRQCCFTQSRIRCLYWLQPAFQKNKWFDSNPSPIVFPFLWLFLARWSYSQNTWATVDDWNPAPPGMYKTCK